MENYKVPSKAVTRSVEKHEEKKHKMAKRMKGGWAEKHGQVPGKQLKGTITSRKFGPKSY